MDAYRFGFGVDSAASVLGLAVLDGCVCQVHRLRIGPYATAVSATGCCQEAIDFGISQAYRPGCVLMVDCTAELCRLDSRRLVGARLESAARESGGFRFGVDHAACAACSAFALGEGTIINGQRTCSIMENCAAVILCSTALAGMSSGILEAHAAGAGDHALAAIDVHRAAAAVRRRTMGEGYGSGIVRGAESCFCKDCTTPS